MRWMKLEPIILSEVSRKNKYRVLMHIHGIQKDSTDEPICMAVSCSLSRVCLFATPWTVAYQAPLSQGSNPISCCGRFFTTEPPLQLLLVVGTLG